MAGTILDEAGGSKRKSGRNHVIYGFCCSSVAAAVSFHNARVFIFHRQTDRALDATTAVDPSTRDCKLLKGCLSRINIALRFH